MSKYFRMKLAGTFGPDITPAGFRIVSYCPALHHNEIPFIYAESFHEAPWDDDWDTFLGFDSEGVFIAVDAGTGKYIGFIISYSKEDYGYISIVAVIPKWRKKAVASSLIRTAIQRFGSMKMETVRVDVEEINTPAINSYKKAGFVIAETFEE